MLYNKMEVKNEQSGNKAVDDFMHDRDIEFFSYDQFTDLKFIAEGGFSKVFKAIWTDSQHNEVALKILKNSKNAIHKVLNELEAHYKLSSQENINRCFGITRDPATEDFMIIMPYYDTDMFHCITSNKFYEISWKNKLSALFGIISGLINMHEAEIIHGDLHSGNILIEKSKKKTNEKEPCDDKNVVICDFGESKSKESVDDSNETYGIIPYMAPEIFDRQKCTKASDIYSFGMIMWEIMTGRRPFWNKIHNAELIIEICNGLRPPTDSAKAPEGYVELMKECWHPDPKKRPPASVVHHKMGKIHDYGIEITESPDIGPVTINNPGAICESRPLSAAMTTRSSISQYIILENVNYLDPHQSNTVSNGKRKFGDSLTVDSSNKDRNIKRRKSFDENYNDYRSIEIDFDINDPSYDNEYVSTDLDFDIIYTGITVR